MTTNPGTTDATSIYQLRIALKDIKPAIWRRIQVSGNVTLYRLHLIIQDAMGWENYHLFEFKIDDVNYGEPDPDDGWYVVKNARQFKLGKALSGGVRRFQYLYDFGDDWVHTILVEKVLPPEDGVHYPQLLAGARACPPEDSGGPWGYGDLLEALADPSHESHEELRAWAGEDFDPEEFDLETMQAWLPRLHYVRPRRRQ